MVETQHGLSPWGWNLLLHFFFIFFVLWWLLKVRNIQRSGAKKYNSTNEWCLMVHLYTMDSIFMGEYICTKNIIQIMDQVFLFSILLSSPTTFSVIIYVSYLCYVLFGVFISYQLYVSTVHTYWIKKVWY